METYWDLSEHQQILWCCVCCFVKMEALTKIYKILDIIFVYVLSSYVSQKWVFWWFSETSRFLSQIWGFVYVKLGT